MTNIKLQIGDLILIKENKKSEYDNIKNDVGYITDYFKHEDDQLDRYSIKWIPSNRKDECIFLTQYFMNDCVDIIRRK